MKTYLKILRVATIAIFMAALAVISVLTFFNNGDSFSIFENRYPERLPQYSAVSLFDGSYFKKWDVWFSDHIVLRNEMLSAHTKIEMDVLKKPVVNDVVILDDLLLPLQTKKYVDLPQIEMDAAVMGGRLSKFNELVTSCGGKFLYVGVPEQSSMLRDRYPSYLENNSEYLNAVEKSFFGELRDKNVPYIDMHSEFLSSGDPTKYYSKIDHHFNTFGAQYTYEKILAKFSDVKGIDRDTGVKLKELENPYLGSRNRKLYNVFPDIEKIVLPDAPVPFTRKDLGKSSPARLYPKPENSTEPVTFGIFMGGDIAETVIDTNRDELPNLLIFGDSFTNPLEMMLYRNFNVMRSLDMRHYGEMSLADYVNKYKPDVVICVRDDTQYLAFEANGKLE